MTPGRAATSAPSLACPACGKPGIWDPTRQALACPSCGTAIDAGPAATGPVPAFAFLPLLRDRPNSGRDWQPGATRVRCGTCGATMEYPAYLAGRDCEACGSPALVPCDATGAPVHPSAVVPFAITEADARERLDAWLRGQRALGSRRRATVDRLRAVYVPCWSFSAKVRIPWRAEERRTDKDGNTEQRAIDGVEELAFDDEIVVAAASVPAELLRQIAPAPASDQVPYDSRYFAGYEVEVYAVNLWDAWDTADARFQKETDRTVRAAAGSGAIGLETWPEWSGHACRQVLVPVYVVDYRLGDIAWTAVVNGRTGQTAGTGPPDWMLRAMAILAAVALLAAAALLVFRAIRWLFAA